MSERTEISFDAALMMALRADAQKELDELPSPAQLKERYPDTSRWDARLQAALHKRRPVLKRVLITVLTLVILTLGALAVSADFRKAVCTMIQKFLPTEMQVTYKVEGEPLEEIPDVPDDAPVPDDAVISTDNIQHLTELIGQMKPMYRDPLRLLAMGYTNREIAESLGLTDEVIRMRLFRGRKLLWKELNSHE